MAGGGGGDSEYDVHINLTALLDVLTNLLFFLLMGFSTAANMTVPNGIALPEGSFQQTAEKQPSLEVGLHMIAFNHEPLMPIGEKTLLLMKSPGHHRIDVVYQRLKKEKNRKRLQKNKKDNDILQVFCDEKVPYAVLQEVLNTAAEAGYPKFRMVTQAE